MTGGWKTLAWATGALMLVIVAYGTAKCSG